MVWKMKRDEIERNSFLRYFSRPAYVVNSLFRQMRSLFRENNSLITARTAK